MGEYQERHELLLKLKTENPSWGRHNLAKESNLPPAFVQRWLKKNGLNLKYGIDDGQKLKGVSTLYDAKGNVKQQWVKTDQDRERLLELTRLAVSSIIEDARGKSKDVKLKPICRDDLMNVFPVVDAHVGLYAWDEETGESYDADKAEKELYQSMKELMGMAPPAKTALILNLADFFHTDTSENKTARSGHILDVDTRWARVFQIGVRLYRNIIELALEKHEKVIVKSAIGNHDDHSILSLAMLMKAYFENNDRVEIELPVNPFNYHVFGNSLIGINHGGIKPDLLPGIMACDMRKEWGETEKHYWYTGHIHHKTGHEFAGCTVESFRKPCANDFWTHSKGYRSDRDVQVITHHIKKGEYSRARVGL